MGRFLHQTDDGSHTLYVEELGEPYHSNHGAIQESMHVFIKQGLLSLNKAKLRILEAGFGTGLNALLTWKFAEELKLTIHYHSVEKYPLTKKEYSQLNFESLIGGIPHGLLNKMHEASWEESVLISDRFCLFKEKADFRSMDPAGSFDLVYFDAFSPDKQPELWSEEVFSIIKNSTKQGALLVSYSSKGTVRRTLISCGFSVDKVPGPPGKREMIRARRI
jgi:tRNA U34 5-methylaminomethyl-2-thiouridine-forming methyltransferase MnmC